MMSRHISLTLITAYILTGCATVNRGTHDHFRIDTVPQGARIITSIETNESIRKRRKNKTITAQYHECNPTPCAIKLGRLSEFTFTVENDGYEPVEMYITNSHKKGSFTANTASAVATTAGTTIGAAAVTAPLVAGTLGVTGATLGATSSVFTFGLIPVEAAVSTGFTAGASAVPSTASLVAGAIPPALALTGGMLLIDAGTGANRNFYPNPVVLELTPKGLPVRYDPAVKIFKRFSALERKYEDMCPIRARGLPQDDEACQTLRREMKTQRQTLRDLTTPKTPKKPLQTEPSIKKGAK